MVNVKLVDEVLEKHGPSLSHQRFRVGHLLPSFCDLISNWRSEQQICTNNSGKALRNTRMTLGCNPDSFVSRRQGGCIVAIQPVGICQIGEYPGLGFQTCFSRSSEAERVGEILNCRRESSCDDLRKATTGLTIDSQIGVSAFYG